MSEETKLGWTTDRKDLVEAVRRISYSDARLLLQPIKDDRAKGLRQMSHERMVNLIMIMVLEGLIPESAVLRCDRQA